MRISISSAGQFHAFDLARQMELRGQLQRLYTAYPLGRVSGIPQSRIASLPWLLYALKGLEKTGATWPVEHLNWMMIASFDRWVANRLDQCDIFHHWSSCGVLSQQTAKKRWQARVICERGSSHILAQSQILADEFDRWGISYRPIDPRIIERELMEYEAADRIVVPSTFAMRSFINLGFDPTKVARVTFGVDLKIFQRIPKTDNVFRILYVGNMSLRKGLPYMLEAVCGLGIPDCEFWLIGSMTGDAEPFFRQYDGCFRYLGIVPRQELYQYYSQASVLILASLEEGMAMVQAQAMACGVPVIATTNSGGEDLFRDGIEGFIVPIRSPEAIREKLVYLYKNPEICQEMGQAAIKHVQSLGGWDRYGDQMTDVYHELLGQPLNGRY